MLRAHTFFELRLLVRNGEQLLLALVIPLAALIGLTYFTGIELQEPRIASVTPGIWTLAVMSTAFTSLAISTAFDRRYGTAKRLAASGVQRWLLLAGKSCAIGIVIVFQLVLLSLVAVILGWKPQGTVVWALPLLVLGAAAFTGLGILLGGTLRAEAVLALANLIWLSMIAIGGVVIPLTSAPRWLDVVGQLTPGGALSSSLRDVLQHGQSPSASAVLVLAAWTVLAWGAAVRWFSWQ
ncbi:ABC transporter permease [Nakamurella antarctica]|uniref:ABC transporter permease n=2 Tax=Nakamurella antarctica TaxID=1902245 RepID=A0A3G8ZQR3_9ACTN|nr:ABC transporter permease [Nakamurella antarctica]